MFEISVGPGKEVKGGTRITCMDDIKEDIRRKQILHAKDKENYRIGSRENFFNVNVSVT